jgi:hypothetical protein
MNATERKAFNHNGKVVYSKPMKAWAARTSGSGYLLPHRGRLSGQAQTRAVQVIVSTNVKLPDPQMILPVPADSNGHKPTQDK